MTIERQQTTHSLKSNGSETSSGARNHRLYRSDTGKTIASTGYTLQRTPHRKATPDLYGRNLQRSGTLNVLLDNGSQLQCPDWAYTLLAEVQSLKRLIMEDFSEQVLQEISVMLKQPESRAGSKNSVKRQPGDERAGSKNLVKRHPGDERAVSKNSVKRQHGDEHPGFGEEKSAQTTDVAAVLSVAGCQLGPQMEQEPECPFHAKNPYATCSTIPQPAQTPSSPGMSPRSDSDLKDLNLKWQTAESPCQESEITGTKNSEEADHEGDLPPSPTLVRTLSSCSLQSKRSSRSRLSRIDAGDTDGESWGDDTEVTFDSYSSLHMLRKALERKGHTSFFRRRRRRGYCIKSVWRFTEDSKSSIAAKWYHRWMIATILCSVVIVYIQMGEDPVLHGDLGFAVGAVFDIIFAIELVVRLFCCPDRWMFCMNVYHQIDIVAVLVSVAFPVVSIAGVDLSQHSGSLPMQMLDAARSASRLMKILGRFENFHLFLSAMAMVYEALVMHIFMMTVIAVFFSFAIWLAEREHLTLPRSLWLTVVTMTTVGYGDTTTTTPIGNMLSCVLMVGSAVYMAIPVGIVGGVFSRIYEGRDRLLLLKTTRDKILRGGYKPRDFKDIFDSYRNQNQESSGVSFDDFMRMLVDMQVGLAHDQICELFFLFDTDRQGTVDDKDFVCGLFPQEFNSIYPDYYGPRRSTMGGNLKF